MYLKRIEIAGFKSFADRTVIDFENSVTAVVGPNGSGKSNITEAIRWVLGEQSAKSLRGGKMPDIIFAGSDSRKQLNIAEVTVVLDNSDDYLPMDYSEISVTRRLRRTGESDFFINKQACRLKDIQDLFMDSGLGKESFSIISQGKVEAIFSSKPEDRRGIFEEAAGVLKYKQRKRKAEQKLFETEDNLSRVQDIVYELEDQLAPLKEQSAAATEFLRLKEAFTQIDVAYTTGEIKQTKALWDEADGRLTELNEALKELSTALQGAENELQVKRQQRADLDNWLEDSNQQLLHLTEALKQAEGQREVFLERSKNTQQSTKEYQANLAEQEDRIQQLDEVKSQLIQELSGKNREVQELDAKIAAMQQELTKYQKTTKEVVEELRGQYMDKLQAETDLGNQLKYLERQHSQESVKNQKAVEKQSQLSQETKETEERLSTLQSELTEIQDRLAKQRTSYRQLQEEAKQGQSQFDQEQKKMYQLMNQVQQVRAKEKSLQDIQDNYTGFYQGVKVVLQHKEQLSGIVGAVAELLEVPKEFTVAIETALGGAAQNIVVQEEKDARQAINFLKERRGGRATFYPLTTIKSRYVSEAVKKTAAKVAGYRGVASELVQYDDRLRNVMENLLGTILIAEDLESANKIAREVAYKYRVVSLAGDVMNAGGSMTGGATKKGNNGNLFAQSNELQELKEQKAVLDERLQKTEKIVQRLEGQVKEKLAALENLRDEGEQGRLQEQDLTSRVNNLKESLARLEKEHKVFSYENREVQAFLEDYEEQKAELLAQQKTVETERQAIDQEITAISDQEDLIEAKREEVSGKLSDLQQEAAVKAVEVNNTKERLAENEAALQEAEERRSSLEHQLEALSMDFSDHSVNEESLQKQVAELGQRREAIQAELAEKREARSALQKEISAADEALSQRNQEQKALLASQTKAEVDKNRADIKLDNLLQYLQEEYSMSFELASQSYPPVEDPQQAKRESQELKRQIERLGPVNLNAIEQYQQVLERYEFLTTQRDDLLAAKDQLFTTMNEMDEEVKTRFGEVFEAIRQKFKVVFPNMFGGGRAELVLTDPTDLLNTGIEIEAQPPGKKLQNLSLLSGGERALTAIALLFSIIQVRPVPFCVLDEVEAALDEANVSRFGQYLSQFQNDTQFIVVTHRKGTMEAANVLYGVTMQESGVSKIVSVRLEDVREGGKIVTGEGEAS